MIALTHELCLKRLNASEEYRLLLLLSLYDYAHGFNLLLAFLFKLEQVMYHVVYVIHAIFALREDFGVLVEDFTSVLYFALREA